MSGLVPNAENAPSTRNNLIAGRDGTLPFEKFWKSMAASDVPFLASVPVFLASSAPTGAPHASARAAALRRQFVAVRGERSEDVQ